jgi:hypothetical protein
MVRALARLVATLPASLLAQGTASTQFQPAPLPALSVSGVRQVLAVDHDRDGDVDLTAGTFLGPPRVLTNDGLGQLVSTTLVIPNLFGTPQLASIDFDGDGDRDLLLSWTTGRALLRWTGGGFADATAALPPLPTMTGFVVADLDNDGDEDAAGCGHALVSGADGILRNQNGVFTWQPAFAGASASIGGADVDGDGDVDIATTSPLRLWRNDGGLTFTDVSTTQLPPLPPHWAHLAFGDVDGDGDQDLVVGDVQSATLVDRLLRNAGAGTFVEVPGAIPAPPAATGTVALADVDDDGDLDLVRGGNVATLCTNDGTGAFTLASGRWPTAPVPAGLTWPADLDRDGDLDVVLAPFVPPASVLWNHHRQLKVPAPPVRGQSWTVELWSQPGYGIGTRAALLAIGLARLLQLVEVPPLGVLWLDLAAPFVLQPASIAAPNGVATLTFAIPNAPALVGIALHCQALVEEHGGVGDVRLTALVTATIQ